MNEREGLMPTIAVPGDVDEALRRLEKAGKIKDKYKFIWDAVRQKITVVEERG